MKKFMIDILEEKRGGGGSWGGGGGGGVGGKEMIGKKYIWNNGFIEMLVDGILKTTWGNGVWKELGERKYIVSWNGFDHVLKFDEGIGRYISVRIKPMDFEVVFGEMV
jgi:hypothetical protein